MKEGFPYNPNLSPDEPDDPANEGSAKGSKKKNRGRTALMHLGRTAGGVESELPSPAEDADGARHSEAAAESGKGSGDEIAGLLGKLLGNPKAEIESPAVAGDAAEATGHEPVRETEFRPEDYPRTLPLDELNASEVIIDLGHPVTVRETVPEPEPAETTEEAPVEVAESPQPVAEPQLYHSSVAGTEQFGGGAAAVEAGRGLQTQTGNSGSGNVPPLPPEGLSPGAAEPPEPERPAGQFDVPPYYAYSPNPEPAQVFRAYAERDAARAAGRERQDAARAGSYSQAYHAGVEDADRGRVMRGLFPTGLRDRYELRRLKRHEKKTAKRHQAVAQKLKAQQWDIKSQAQKQTETDRRLHNVEAQLASAERHPGFKAPSAHEIARIAERQAQEQVRAHEMQTARAAEQPTEKIEVPHEHRLQTSAWHTIEVDARTGRPVERPTFQYGHEYYRERAQEAMPIGRRNAAAGEVALVAAAQAGAPGPAANAGSSAGSQTVQVPDATRQGPPQSLPSSSDNQSDNVSSSLWPYVLALLIIGALLYALLR